MAFRSASATPLALASQGSTSNTVPSPTGVAQHDVVVNFIASSTNGGLTTISGPAGFTLQDSIHQSTSISQGPHCNLGYLILPDASASEPSNYVITGSPAPFTDLGAISIAFSGRNNTTPVAFFAQTLAAGTGSPVNFNLNAFTCLGGEDVLLMCIAGEGASCVWTPPSGFTAIASIQTPTPFGNYYVCYKNNVAAGSLAGLLGVVETGLGTDRIGFAVALAPAPAGGTSGPSGLGSRVFGANNQPMPLKAAAYFMPLAWVIERRQKLAREWKRDEKTGLILPNLKRGLK